MNLRTRDTLGRGPGECVSHAEQDRASCLPSCHVSSRSSRESSEAGCVPSDKAGPARQGLLPAVRPKDPQEADARRRRRPGWGAGGRLQRAEAAVLCSPREDRQTRRAPWAGGCGGQGGAAGAAGRAD